MIAEQADRYLSELPGEIGVLPGSAVGSARLSFYVRVIAWYFVGMAICWALGIEGIYGSPLPFYALLSPPKTLAPLLIPALVVLSFVWCRRFLFPGPIGQTRSLEIAFGISALVAIIVLICLSAFKSLAGSWAELRWHLPVLLVGCAGFAALIIVTQRTRWFVGKPTRRFANWFLVGLVAFAILFSGSVAMIRNGPEGISQAYMRHGYEYVGDIGTTGTIHALFRDYLKYRPHLSMHAKVHPPGPIALLWLISYISGQDAFSLSIATIILGALGVIPLYLLAREIAGRRVGLTAALLYVLMPSIVLFTATSTDILFLPISTSCLWLFWRAAHKPSVWAGLAAGVLYGLASLLSFSLLTLGAVFAAVGLVRMLEPGRRRAVIQTAVLMLAGFFAVHFSIWWWSGFNYMECYQACKAQFELDQINLDKVTPRFPWWAWKFLNPICWFYFAGIPVSMMFLRRIFKPETSTRGVFYAMGAAFVVMSLLYLARGEGERSAMYILPLLVIPAAHMLEEAARRVQSAGPILVAAGFLAAQCWVTETIFYTFW